jgi:hypothetical protein
MEAHRSVGDLASCASQDPEFDEALRSGDYRIFARPRLPAEEALCLGAGCVANIAEQGQQLAHGGIEERTQSDEPIR